MRNLLIALAMTLVLGGCGDDSPGVGTNGPVVGGACLDQGDCASTSVCLTSGDFPGGTCSVPCHDDRDCPPDTVCVEKQGGSCLLSCLYPADCRPGYTCKGVDRAGIAGEALVCIED